MDDGLYGVNVALANGSVHFLRTDNLSPEELRKILEIGDCTDGVLQSHGEFSSAGRLNWPNIAALLVWLLSVGTLLTAARVFLHLRRLGDREGDADAEAATSDLEELAPLAAKFAELDC